MLDTQSLFGNNNFLSDGLTFLSHFWGIIAGLNKVLQLCRMIRFFIYPFIMVTVIFQLLSSLLGNKSVVSLVLGALCVIV
ncbi:MAG: hypothetical protein CSA47_01570 [Gammaproteobacteria bacterium]|nr:MAG: hypothetical protein CSA47_01570 [Gammaproteobacteria bacterium]